mmetsp:Transcript_14849/g.39625  ORF Transcript_14849/g.39625 Transcript_14849/m.39625 type:complete len:85 (+) Transcript_14849:2-256(+)
MRSRVRQGVPGGPACVRFVALLLAGICAWEAEAAKKKSAARGLWIVLLACAALAAVFIGALLLLRCLEWSHQKITGIKPDDKFE